MYVTTLSDILCQSIGHAAHSNHFLTGTVLTLLAKTPRKTQSGRVGARLSTSYLFPGRARTAKTAQCADAVEDSDAHSRTLAMQEGLGPAPPAVTCMSIEISRRRAHPRLLQAARRACMKALAPKPLPGKQCTQGPRLKPRVKLSCGRTWGRGRPTRPWPPRSGGRSRRWRSCMRLPARPCQRMPQPSVSRMRSMQKHELSSILIVGHGRT